MFVSFSDQKLFSDPISPISLTSKILYFFLVIATFQSWSVHADDRQELKLKHLKKVIEELQDSILSRTEKQLDLEIDFKTGQTEIRNLEHNIRSIISKIDATEKEIVIKQKKKDSIQNTIEDQSDAIIEHLRTAHQLGSQETTKLLLNQEDPQKLARILKYYDYFLRARNDKVLKYTANIADLSKILEDIIEDKVNLIASRNTLYRERKKVSLYLANRASILDSLLKKISGDKKRLSDLTDQRANLEDLLDDVGMAEINLSLYDEFTSFRSLKGNLNWPTNGKVINRFGSKRSGPIRWDGWLIAVKKGSSVKTVHPGRVVFSNYLRGFGLMLILDHGDGFVTLYGHNEELLKEAGDWVQSNEEIAKAGNTGGLVKPGLYFEIRNQGQPTNPNLWLNAK